MRWSGGAAKGAVEKKRWGLLLTWAQEEGGRELVMSDLEAVAKKG